MVAVSDARALYLLELVDRKALPAEPKRLAQDARGDTGLNRPAPTEAAETALARYFSGRGADFDIALAPGGTAFQNRFGRRCAACPPARPPAMARPMPQGAVARANGANRIAILIPCHRVIGADGSLTGYGSGLWRKERLIALERNYARERVT